MGERKELDALQVAKVVNLLDQYFDKTAGLYREGWSDTKIAGAIHWNNTNAVARIRNKFYGSLKNEGSGSVNVMKGFRNELDTMLKMISDLQNDLLQVATIVRNMPQSPMSQAMLKSLQDKYYKA